MVFVIGLLSRKIIRHARKRGVEYSFLFVHPDGSQLAEIGKLLEAGSIRPVIDKVFPFDQAKEALAHLEKGRAGVGPRFLHRWLEGALVSSSHPEEFGVEFAAAEEHFAQR